MGRGSDQRSVLHSQLPKQTVKIVIKEFFPVRPVVGQTDPPWTDEDNTPVGKTVQSSSLLVSPSPKRTPMSRPTQTAVRGES